MKYKVIVIKRVIEKINKNKKKNKTFCVHRTIGCDRSLSVKDYLCLLLILFTKEHERL